MNITISYFENADNLLFYFIIIPFYLGLVAITLLNSIPIYYLLIDIVIGIMLIATRFIKPYEAKK
jgi:hypothetical protein